MTNYKKLYAERFGITWGNDLEIHHIDRNRNNNDISNLILLPGELHRQLHKYLSEVMGGAMIEPSTRYFIERTVYGILNYGSSYNQESLLHLTSTLSECERWGFLKRVSYHYPNGSPIGHITKDTMKWIG